MDIKIYLQDSGSGENFDISTLAGPLQIETYLAGQPGKLTFTLQQDPNNLLKISSGSVITVIIDGEGVFFGYVFTMGTDATQTYKVTAYDQLRYLKNEEVYLTKNQTASQIFELICSQAQLRHSVKTPSVFVCPAYLHDKKSRYTIIEYGINQALLNTQKYHFVRDDFGTLIFSELQNEKTDLIIGDKSLLSNYQYEISIDKETFNEVKIVRDNEETGKRDVWVAKDSSTQTKWGVLRFLEKADKDMNEAKIKELAQNILKVKNRETKTIKLNALGDRKIKAGSGFILNLEAIQIREWMWIESVTHTYAKDLHLMSMGVFI